MSFFKSIFSFAKGKKVSWPCPNCGGQVLETESSPENEFINTLRCSRCGWSKLACGSNCGSYLKMVRTNEYGEAWYKCVSCGWTGGGARYKGDSDGRPQKSKKEKRPAKESKAVAASENSKESCLAFFMFNSDKISDEVSSAYGAYSQGELLKSLSAVIKPDGGWEQIKVPLVACDGDLIDITMFGNQPATDMIEKWIRQKHHSVDAGDVDQRLRKMIERGGKLKFIVYIVGIGPITKAHALSTSRVMREQDIIGYQGVMITDDNTPLPIVAHELHLPVQMKILNATCSGWLASKNALEQAGLSPS